VEGVRRATADDAQRCTEILAAAIEGTRGQRGAALLLEAERDGDRPDIAVAHWLADPQSAVILGTFSDVAVGIGAGRIVTPGERPLGRIECFYVEPDARAVGVGHAIVEGLVEWFAERGCREVDAVALPGDRSSKQLLESSGFKARLLILHRSLG